MSVEDVSLPNLSREFPLDANQIYDDQALQSRTNPPAEPGPSALCAANAATTIFDATSSVSLGMGSLGVLVVLRSGYWRRRLVASGGTV
jgi:hypothetical protein